MTYVLGIIPARGGSKGLPRKNIRAMNGKPLIAYSIEAALTSKYINYVTVSTEDDEIAKVSANSGAEIIARPPVLATDEAKSIDVVLNVLDTVENDGSSPDLVVLLQPTSPLRTSGDIDRAIEISIDNDYAPVISAMETPHSPYWCFTIADGILAPIFDERYLQMRRQDLPMTYMPNGAIYVAKPAFLRTRKSFLSSETRPYIMPPDRSVDIDTETDFLICEALIRKSIQGP